MSAAGFGTDFAPLIRPLQVFVVAIIFVMFLRVMRSVWVESRPPKAPKVPKTPKGDKTPRLKTVYLEIKEPKDLAGERFAILRDLTIGRSALCDIYLADDSYASTNHARVSRIDDAIVVEDLGSTNGVLVNDTAIGAPTAVTKGDKIRIGSTLFEITR